MLSFWHSKSSNTSEKSHNEGIRCTCIDFIEAGEEKIFLNDSNQTSLSLHTRKIPLSVLINIGQPSKVSFTKTNI